MIRADSPRRLTMSNHLLVSLLVLQIVVGTIAVGRARGIWSDDRPADSFAMLAPAAIRPTSIESAVLIGRDVARRWSDDSVLMTASLQVDWPWEVPVGERDVAPGGWVFLTFRTSGGQTGETLSLVVERLSGRVVSTEEVAWDTPPTTEVRVESDFSTSLDAVAVVEQRIGRAYRQACPERRHLTRVSLVSQTGPDDVVGHRWLVTYDDTQEPNRNTLSVIVDAITGRIVEVDDRSLPCDAGAAT